MSDNLRPLDHHLIHADPHPIYQGEVPLDYAEVPAPVIVNLCGVHANGSPYSSTIHVLPILDSVESAQMIGRARFERFLDAVHISASAGPSYWHCHAGINRATFALAAYLHRHRGLRISDAIALIRTQRYSVCLCNSLFEGTLRGWYGQPDELEFEPVDIQRWLEQRTGAIDPDTWKG